MLGHHLIAVVTFYATLVFMNFLTVFGVMLLFVEISTIFVCFRYLIYTHKLQRTCWNNLNSLCVFVTFLFGRLLYQIFILSGYAYPLLIKYVYEEENLPWWKVSLIVEIYVATSISATMNSYWMYLIIC